MSSIAKQDTLLARYLLQLAIHPLRTKALTTGTLCLLQEVLGSHLAGVPPKRLPSDSPAVAQILARAQIDGKAFKMGLYGFLISAPLSHYLMGALQRAFAGKTSGGAKLAQLLASNLLVAPIQTAAFLASMAIINGAKSVQEVLKTVKAAFFRVIKINWVVSPVSLVIAQKFVPLELWVPFFSAIQFVLGTFFNMKLKQAKLAQIKREKAKAKEQAEKSAAKEE